MPLLVGGCGMLKFLSPQAKAVAMQREGRTPINCPDSRLGPASRVSCGFVTRSAIRGNLQLISLFGAIRTTIFPRCQPVSIYFKASTGGFFSVGRNAQLERIGPRTSSLDISPNSHTGALPLFQLGPAQTK